MSYKLYSTLCHDCHRDYVIGSYLGDEPTHPIHCSGCGSINMAVAVEKCVLKNARVTIDPALKAALGIEDE